MSRGSSGILKLSGKGAGQLLNLADKAKTIFVPANVIRKFRLTDGALVAGPVQNKGRNAQLIAVDTINGLSPQQYQLRTPFRRLVAVDPNQRFNLAVSGQNSMRLIDLIAPLGKGSRGLIVAPPKAGKTVLLEQLGHAVQADEPETRLIVLLIDERPEEVTHFRRALSGAEVYASSSDQPLIEHIDLAELLMAHIRTELECGHNIVVLLDSLTRLVRAFNLRGNRGKHSRTLSGGVDAEALQIPRRFFGLARNIEHGGSVTIVATVLVETGSRMDQFIYEEFKGTGNSEIVLDRALAEAYLYPAINLPASSTRKEELLLNAPDVARLTQLRRSLTTMDPKRALQMLLNMLDKYPTNETLLQNLPV